MQHPEGHSPRLRYQSRRAAINSPWRQRAPALTVHSPDRTVPSELPHAANRASDADSPLSKNWILGWLGLYQQNGVASSPAAPVQCRLIEHGHPPSGTQNAGKQARWERTETLHLAEPSTLASADSGQVGSAAARGTSSR